jgi:hypothetical protein
MSLIIPANTLASGGFTVDNSCRFNSGSTDSLDRTPSSSGNGTTFTMSMWLKRSGLGGTHLIYKAKGSAQTEFTLAFNSDKLQVYQVNSGGAQEAAIKTLSVQRDISAWYHACIQIQTADGTATDRCKIYINGVQQTIDPSGTDAYSSSFNTGVNQASVKQEIGGAASPYGGYMAEFVMIDGSILAPTSFGEFDEDSGIWKPIDVSGLTFGTNGFYLDFEDSSALGNDVSGNNNDFTANNLTSIDQATDTCTNNFATMNPLIPGQTNYTYSDGNTTISQSSAAWVKSNSTIGMSSGKWYWEVKYVSGNYIVASVDNTDTATPYGPTSTSAVSYKRNGDLEVATVPQTALASYAHGDIVSVALDMDNSCVYFGKNGTWLNSGNPTSGASKTGAYSLPVANSTYFATFSIYDGSGGYSSLNFGNPAYAISSSNTDGDGYGNFEYAVPSGYYALNTKNVAESGA